MPTIYIVDGLWQRRANVKDCCDAFYNIIEGSRLIGIEFSHGFRRVYS